MLDDKLSGKRNRYGRVNNPSAFCERNIYLYYSMETEETKGLYYLAQQFIHPVKVLRKIEVPVKKDKNTREIYLLPAFLGRKGYDPVFKALEKLKGWFKELSSHESRRL